MKLTSAAITAAASIFCAAPAAAQYYNPNSSYANPDATTTNVYRKKGPCGDPWVTIALINVYGKADPAKCNVALYNGGRWSNFNQLVHAVGKKKNAPTPVQIDLRTVLYQCQTVNKCILYSGNKLPVGSLNNGQLQVNVGVIGGNTASVIGQNGANVIGQNGASLIQDGGAYIVANNTSRAISAAIEANPPVSPYSGYALQGINNFAALKAKTKGR